MGVMENSDYARELNSPPQYTAQGYEALKEEMEFRNSPGRQIQSTVVTIMPEAPPVRDHIIWSLFNTMYMNFCCLGLIALVFSVKSRDRKLLGDKSGAHSYGTTARSLNIAATTLSVLFVVVMIIIVIVNVTVMVKMGQEYMNNQRNKEYGQEFGK
ncbi:interferon-induced transmembrane protein 1-like [Pseudophryne corroboree]|uniref:interferon-induced transmembrane protein 1-like n=1 Tax=Pseudophryne corroboree TaxID=495146 RepID=UPI00308153CC